MFTIYTFDDTKEYKGTSVTMLDPEETKRQGKEVWLMPPNATTVKPTIKKGYAPVWDGKAWKQIEDHRGEKGWVNREPVEIKELGPLPEGFSTEDPEPTEEEKKAIRKQEILAELDRIDRATARSLRAIVAAQTAGKVPDAADVERMRAIEAEAQMLRLELARLQ